MKDAADIEVEGGWSDLPWDGLIPISAIEHYSYCARQCALIHVDQIFDENVHTIRGRLAHKRVHAMDESTPRGIRTVRGAPLWSDRLGIVGKADVVEFRAEGPYPVEYKIGRRRGHHADVQLCAQALCLEEMLDVPVRCGAVFYFDAHRRHEVEFGTDLRQVVVDMVGAIRSMLARQAMPAALNDERCRRCSIRDSCLPEVVANRQRMTGLQSALFRIDDQGSGS
jgi:CRISPR-associated exonuclease Cas4